MIVPPLRGKSLDRLVDSAADHCSGLEWTLTNSVSLSNHELDWLDPHPV